MASNIDLSIPVERRTVASTSAEEEVPLLWSNDGRAKSFALRDTKREKGMSHTQIPKKVAISANG